MAHLKQIDVVVVLCGGAGVPAALGYGLGLAREVVLRVVWRLGYSVLRYNLPGYLLRRSTIAR